MITLISIETDRFELSDGSVHPVPFIYRELPHGLQYYIDAFVEAKNNSLTAKK